MEVVTLREERVSRNLFGLPSSAEKLVTLREERVSRNKEAEAREKAAQGHAPRGACE